MKKLIFLISFLPSLALAQGEYDGIYKCTARMTGTGVDISIDAYYTFHTRSDGQAALVLAMPLPMAYSVGGYYIGRMVGTNFFATAPDGTAFSISPAVDSAGALTYQSEQQLVTKNGAPLKSVQTCTKIW